MPIRVNTSPSGNEKRWRRVAGGFVVLILHGGVIKMGGGFFFENPRHHPLPCEGTLCGILPDVVLYLRPIPRHPELFFSSSRTVFFVIPNECEGSLRFLHSVPCGGIPRSRGVLLLRPFGARAPHRRFLPPLRQSHKNAVHFCGSLIWEGAERSELSPSLPSLCKGGCRAERGGRVVKVRWCACTTTLSSHSNGTRR